jgi:hypothetical protein
VRTIVALENSNCTRCHKAMLVALRERQGVQSVWSDFSAGCLVIEHEDDPDALVSLITTADRAVAVAANGERVMVSLDGHEAAECQVSKGTVGITGVAEGPTSATAQEAVGGGPPEPVSLSPGGAPSSKTMVEGASLSGPANGERGGRAGVRVLSRERPVTGSVLRALRFLVRMFRTVFGLPSGPR